MQRFGLFLAMILPFSLFAASIDAQPEPQDPYANKVAKASDEWKKTLEMQGWDGQFLRAAEFSKYLDKEYAATRAIMVEMGIAK